MQSQCDISAFSTSPQGITYTSTDNFAIAFAIVDDSADEIFFIDSDCNLIDQMDTATFGINSLAPTGIAHLPTTLPTTTTDQFAITDRNKDAISIVDTSKPDRLAGQFSTSIFNSGYPQGISLISANGHFAIIDSTADEVFVVNANGLLQSRFDTSYFSSNPQGIAFDSDNEVFAIVDSTDDEVTLLNLHIALPPTCECDLNHDGKCDMEDWLLFGEEWGRTDCPN